MPNGRAPRALRISGKIIKILFSVAVFAVIGLLLWRVFIATIPPGSVEALVVTDDAREVFAANGGKITLRTQDQPTALKAGDYKGMFTVSGCVFLPEVHQVQVVLCYTDLPLQQVQKAYGLEQTPQKGDDVFDVTLFARYGEPGTTEESDAPCKRFHATEELTVRDTTSLYTYFRYTFENVDMEDALVLYADLYYNGDKDYEKEALGVLRLYHVDDDWIDVSLTDQDRKALAGE